MGLLEDQELARNLLEATSFQELYARMYWRKRADLLDDLLVWARNTNGTTEERRAREISEICGQVEQLQEFVPDLFSIAAYREGENHPKEAWQKRLKAPQESEVSAWKQQSPPRPEQRRARASLLLRLWTEFCRIITSILPGRARAVTETKQ